VLVSITGHLNEIDIRHTHARILGFVYQHIHIFAYQLIAFRPDKNLILSFKLIEMPKKAIKRVIRRRRQVSHKQGPRPSQPQTHQLSLYDARTPPGMQTQYHTFGTRPLYGYSNNPSLFRLENQTLDLRDQNAYERRYMDQLRETKESQLREKNRYKAEKRSLKEELAHAVAQNDIKQKQLDLQEKQKLELEKQAQRKYDLSLQEMNLNADEALKNLQEKNKEAEADNRQLEFNIQKKKRLIEQNDEYRRGEGLRKKLADLKAEDEAYNKILTSTKFTRAIAANAQAQADIERYQANIDAQKNAMKARQLEAELDEYKRRHGDNEWSAELQQQAAAKLDLEEKNRELNAEKTRRENMRKLIEQQRLEQDKLAIENAELEARANNQKSFTDLDNEAAKQARETGMMRAKTAAQNRILSSYGDYTKAVDDYNEAIGEGAYLDSEAFNQARQAIQQNKNAEGQAKKRAAGYRKQIASQEALTDAENGLAEVKGENDFLKSDENQTINKTITQNRQLAEQRKTQTMKEKQLVQSTLDAENAQSDLQTAKSKLNYMTTNSDYKTSHDKVINKKIQAALYDEQKKSIELEQAAQQQLDQANIAVNVQQRLLTHGLGGNRDNAATIEQITKEVNDRRGAMEACRRLSELINTLEDANSGAINHVIQNGYSGIHPITEDVTRNARWGTYKTLALALYDTIHSVNGRLPFTRRSIEEIYA